METPRGHHAVSEGGDLLVLLQLWLGYLGFPRGSEVPPHACPIA